MRSSSKLVVKITERLGKEIDNGKGSLRSKISTTVHPVCVRQECHHPSTLRLAGFCTSFCNDEELKPNSWHSHVSASKSSCLAGSARSLGQTQIRPHIPLVLRPCNFRRQPLLRTSPNLVSSSTRRSRWAGFFKGLDGSCAAIGSRDGYVITATNGKTYDVDKLLNSNADQSSGGFLQKDRYTGLTG